ncbi:MAG: hypothetical protein CMD27_02525 [Flavobacteriales bacterium]|nr:hypothetical protein [Flavobacteriales bacterium]
MKKTLLITLSLLLGLSNYAQINKKNINHVPMSSLTEIIDINTPSAMGGDEILWSHDFSDTTMIMSEDIAGFGNWRWSTTSPGGQWSENAGVIESETPENGFMLMEADFFNTSPQNGVADGEVGENLINASFTIGPIDLSTSDTEQLVLQFYSNYRICCYYSPSDQNDLNVYISTDGGVTFNDVAYVEGETYEVNVEKETFSQIPLANYAPNTNDVYFKFEWVGTHYFWMIDDLSVIQRPAYDLKMQSSWLTMENPQYIEYYSIPESQMPDQMLIGAEVYNYGYNDEVNINLTGTIDGTNSGANIEYEMLESDSTGLIETEYFDLYGLTPGTYSFSAVITSSGDDPTPEDNTLTREFEISENIYSIDGLYNSSEWMGTGWPGGDDTADGVRYANFFDIKEDAMLTSITVDLNTSEHPTSLGTFQTAAGGELIAYVCDTTGIFDPNVTELNPDFGGAIWQSDFLLVTQGDVDNEKIVINVPELSLEVNAYYIVIEMYSNGLSNDILINDDTSVAQPWFASLVFYPNDQTWYSNPNAASIRIGLNESINLSENNLNGIDFFPNPTSNFIEISSEQTLHDNCIVSIYNMLGELTLRQEYDNFDKTQIIDLNHLVAGSYIIEFKNNQLQTKKKLIIE